LTIFEPEPICPHGKLITTVVPPPSGSYLSRKAILAILFLLLIPVCLSQSEPKVDPQTKRIRLLFIGDPFLEPGYPTTALLEDPKIHLTRIEAEIGYRNPALGKERMLRFLRIYLPRTEDTLIENYDMLIITAIQSNHLKHEFQLWTKKAVEEEGFGFLMSDDPTSFGGALTVWTTGPPWDDTPVGSILPVYQEEHITYRDHNFRIMPTGPGPITDGIPWERMPLIWSHNRPRPKQGATVLGVTTDETFEADPKNDPIITYWDFGKGRTLAFMWDWGGNGIVSFYRWEYWKDVIARIAYFPARATIPSDLSITHNLRLQIGLYSSEKGLVLSFIDFADTFGANTNPLNHMLGVTDRLRRNVDQLWIEEQFEECLPAMDAALSSLEAVMEEAVKAKDRALLWVYVIEWMTVAGTSILAGVIVWSLMVRRRLYREVAVTRFES
jgi:uncharacterized membrane protein